VAYPRFFNEGLAGSGNKALALGDLYNFSIKITHIYAYFSQNSYFKATTHQLKAFKISLNVLNRINVLSYSYKYTFATGGGGGLNTKKYFDSARMFNVFCSLNYNRSLIGL